MVGFDDKRVGALGTALDDARRHGEPPFARGQQQAGVHELPGPQPQVGVGEGRLQLDGARRLVDLIVDHRQRPFPQVAGVIAADREHFHRVAHRAARRVVADRLEILLGQSEQDGDGAELRDDHHAARVGGVDDVALIHLPHADPAGQRRGDPGIIELGAGVLDGRLVALDRGDHLVDQISLRVVGLLVQHPFLDQVVVPREHQARVVELRLVLRLLGDRLVELCLVGPGIDLGEHVAGLDILALREKNLVNRAVHARPYRHRVEGLHRAKTIQVDRDISLGHHPGHHGHGKVGHEAVRPATMASGGISPGHASTRRSGLGGGVTVVVQPGSSQQDGEQGEPENFFTHGDLGGGFDTSQFKPLNPWHLPAENRSNVPRMPPNAPREVW